MEEPEDDHEVEYEIGFFDEDDITEMEFNDAYMEAVGSYFPFADEIF